MSNEAHISEPGSHDQSATQKTQCHAVSSNSKSKGIHSKPILINADQDIHSEHDNDQKYATDIVAGMSTLGIDTPSYLQQSLVDQHGSSVTRMYSYRTVVGEEEFSVGPQDLDLGSTPPQVEWSPTYAYNDGYSNGELAGIGSQFYG